MLLLLAGTLFAWFTVGNDYMRYLSNEGINPLETPCFYGAIGFLLSYLFSVYILFSRKEKQKNLEKYLVLFLIAGTLFGWGNFVIELCKFYIFKGPKTSCSGYIVSTPFATPCFYGSMLYLISLTASILTFKKLKLN